MTKETVADPAQRPLTFNGIERGTSTYWCVCIALFFAGFSTFSLLYCVQPLLPLLAQEYVISPAQSSLSLSLSTGFLAVAILCAAPLSEMAGRRGLMFWSMTGAAALNIAAAFLSNWYFFLVARALEGFILGGVPAIAMAYLAEEINPRELGLVMGLYVGGTAFGGMIGRVGSGILAELYSWQASLVVIGFTGVAAALAFFFLLPKSQNFSRHTTFDKDYHLNAWAHHLNDKTKLRLYAVGFLIMGTFVAIYNYAGFRLMKAPYNLSPTELSAIFTVYLFGILSSSVTGSLTDKFGKTLVLRLAITTAAIGIVLTASSDIHYIILGIVFLTIGFFGAHTTASSSIGSLAKTSRAHASSLYLLAYYLGSSLIGSSAGWFFNSGGWGSIVLFTLFLLLIAFVIVPKIGNYKSQTIQVDIL